MKTFSYNIQTLMPLISWEHFFFPWKVLPYSDEAQCLKHDAIKFLDDGTNFIKVKCLYDEFQAHISDDDIIIGGRRIPFLRQQRPNDDGTCLCISDFINEGGRVGVFATAVHCGNNSHKPFFDNSVDPYRELLQLTICDRLAEAAAEQLQREVEETHSLGKDFIIRPAVGYPSIPDMSINFLLNDLCGFDKIGISLTENGMMQPHSAVSGFIISHPQARYFSVGPVTDEQLNDYASRRGLTLEETKKYIYA